MNRLQEKYNETVKPSLMKEYNYSSVMECPKLVKVVINMGVGDAIANAKALDEAYEEMTLIAGQKPVISTSHCHESETSMVFPTQHPTVVVTIHSALRNS